MSKSKMALQIANPAVVAKIETLARLTGLNKTAAVEQAVDNLLRQKAAAQPEDVWRRFDALLKQMDEIPDCEGWVDPLQWDENGLPI